MDHLTGFSREEASYSDTEPDFGVTFRRNSQPNYEPRDTSLTNPRPGARAMLPVSERKPGRGAPMQDAAAMSYEKALRIHGRRRSPPAVTPAASAMGAPPLKAGANTPKSQPARAKAELPVAPSVARSASQNPRPAKASAAAPAQAASSRLATPAAPRAISRIEPVSGSVPAAEYSKSSLRRPKKPPVASLRTTKTTPEKVAAASNPAKSRRKSKPAPNSPRNRSEEIRAANIPAQAGPGEGVSRETSRAHCDSGPPVAEVMEPEFAGSHLELLDSLGQLDQRRTIVSVRLTEGEFACLRDRAEESGISVSAYMRSCVVDAEQLRTQVKRALAEMRSLSTPAGTGQAALATSNRGSGNSETVQGWFQLILRPLTFLFGPLFPSRRSA